MMVSDAADTRRFFHRNLCLETSCTIWLCHGCPKSHLVLGCCMGQQSPACSNCRTSASCHQMAGRDLREERMSNGWGRKRSLVPHDTDTCWMLYLSKILTYLKGKWEEKKNDSPSSGKLLMTLTAAANFASRLRLSSSSSSAMLGANKDGMKEGVVASISREGGGEKLCSSDVLHRCLCVSTCLIPGCALLLYWGCGRVPCWRSIRPFATRPCPSAALSLNKHHEV